MEDGFGARYRTRGGVVNKNPPKTKKTLLLEEKRGEASEGLRSKEETEEANEAIIIQVTSANQRRQRGKGQRNIKVEKETR